MSTLQARSLSRASVPLVPQAARLELLEYYLVHYEDLSRSAQASLEWLARHAAVRCSRVLEVNNDAGMLVGITGVGVSADAEVLQWPLSDTRDPFIAALSAAEPVAFGRPARVNGGLGRLAP